MDYYKQIFKRKSFHIFKDTDTLTGDEIQELKDFIKTVKPLNAEIKTEICIANSLWHKHLAVSGVPENYSHPQKGAIFAPAGC